MSETAKKARAAMKAKASRLAASDPKMKVDSSSWSPAEPLDTDAKTGARPLVKRLYKKGGKVLGKCEGGATMKRADRKARKSGGRTEAEKREKRYLTPDNLINRDVRMANDAREGKKHDGAFKKGGKAGNRTGKMGGGVMGDNPVSMQNRSMSKAAGMAYKKGGKAKREHHANGNPVGSSDAQKEFMDLIKKSEANQTEQEIKNLIARDKFGNVPTPPRRQYKNVEELIEANPERKSSSSRSMPPVDQMGNPTGMKKGGKAKKMSHMEWEHSKADLKLDKKLAKKHGMSMEKWEKSKLDEKHDKQQSTEGMKKGGRTAKYAGGGVFSGDSKTKIPGATGGRSAHAKGGKAGKSKTNINIIIGAGGMGQKPELGDGMMPNAPVGAPPRPLPVPPPAAMPQGGAPMPMPPMGGGMGGGDAGGPPMPPMAMARKSGGRTIHVINHGSGGGKGRLEKIKAYGLKPAR